MSSVTGTPNDTSLIYLIQSGFTFAVVMAWSDAVKAGASYVYPNNTEKAFEAQVVYAIIITIIVIAIFYFLQTTKNEIAKLKESINLNLIEMQKIKQMNQQAKTHANLYT